jgi:hypothetical protein
LSVPEGVLGDLPQILHVVLGHEVRVPSYPVELHYRLVHPLALVDGGCPQRVHVEALIESYVPSAVYAHNRAVTRVWLGIVLGPELPDPIE